MNLPQPIRELIEEFNKFPGIGSKTAEKFAYYLLKQPRDEIDKLISSLQKIKTSINLCQQCYNFSEKTSCELCSDPHRDKSILCIVSDSADLWALEKTNEYKGLYYILGGLINQIDGVGPDQLRFKELIERIKKNGVKEIILALDATMEGETTVLYLTKALKSLSIKITRLARGLPMGSDIEYADEVTLTSALSGRREIK
jgi:recombination protein RecR